MMTMFVDDRFYATCPYIINVTSVANFNLWYPLDFLIKICEKLKKLLSIICFVNFNLILYK